MENFDKLVLYKRIGHLMLGVIVPFVDKGVENFLKVKDTIIEEHKNKLKKNHTMLIDAQ